MGRRTIVAAQIVLLTTSLVVVVATSHASDWRPTTLVALLAVIAVASDVAAIETKTLRMTGSFIALVLAMALLGPGPAVAIGLLTIVIAAIRDKTGPAVIFTNVVAYATFPLVGGPRSPALTC